MEGVKCKNGNRMIRWRGDLRGVNVIGVQSWALPTANPVLPLLTLPPPSIFLLISNIHDLIDLRLHLPKK
ncbi:hypothetical protein Csa_004122 [Cucumis sativus]|uniref:Uncharacterized protein n=1 Tax=Cucumis sativus TaxID=3659 RepID=A0A0A0KIL4_CUCSA|nr:hypothetical protein Csa_004122 [Cucumis sativus]